MSSDSSDIANTGISPVMEFQSSGLQNAGMVLDAADGGVVRIRGRRHNYVLIREDDVASFVATAMNRKPMTFEDMVRGFTPEDAAEIRAKLSGWMTFAVRTV